MENNLSLKNKYDNNTCEIWMFCKLQKVLVQVVNFIPKYILKNVC